jgi:uncharacterized protein YbjT (DUF2867 family)
MRKMVVAVTGGTGTVGRHVVQELAASGHEVRVLTRHPPRNHVAGVEHRRVDLATGEGLDQALAGAEAVVDAANRPGTGRRAASVIVDGTQRVLEAERRAGVGHHVAVSIVGIEKVPYSYYEAKVEQERAVRGGGVPWSIVRATQFHELVDMAFAAPARAGLLLAPDIRLQPVDPRHVAGILAGVVQNGPLGDWKQVAGPRVERLRDLARAWRAATGRRARIVALPLPRRIGVPLAAGALVPETAVTGGPSFRTWLTERRSEAAPAQSTGGGMTIRRPPPPRATCGGGRPTGAGPEAHSLPHFDQG